MYALQESVRQLRGTAAAQVPDAQISNAHAVGGRFAASGTVVMTNQGPQRLERIRNASAMCSVERIRAKEPARSSTKSPIRRSVTSRMTGLLVLHQASAIYRSSLC